MTALPPSTDFTGGSTTEGQFKTAITSLRTFISELIGTSGTDKVAAQTALGAILCDSLDKSGAYTVVAADKGKVINCTSGTWSLSLTAAATLADGFQFAVWNNGSGVITIDPNASETIDGATTKTLAAGKLAIVYCDGAKFITVGSIATGSGSGLDADLLDGQHGSYYGVASSVVAKDMGAGFAVGFFYAFINNSGGGISSGGTIAAASLGAASPLSTGPSAGTWRNIGQNTVNDASGGIFQRIS